MAQKKKWIAPKEFQIGEISAKTIVVPPCDDKERYIVNNVNNHNQIHHTLACAKELNEMGKYVINWEPMMTSAFYLQMGKDGDHSYIFYADIYANWARYYQDVSSVINAMLSRTNEATPPDELKALLWESLEKKGYRTDVIQAAYAANAPRVGQMTAELFRQVATCVLIQEKLDRDADGLALMKLCRAAKGLYCDDLDTHPEKKETIYGACRIADSAVDEPAERYVDDMFKWTMYDEKRATLANKIDYSKSPGIAFKLFISMPKREQKTEGKVMLPTGQVVWTAIYDMINRKMADANTAISTYEEFAEFVYFKGDNTKGKPCFRLLQALQTLEICVFWSSLTKRGSFQFKTVDQTVYKKIPFSSGTRALTASVMQNRMAAGQRALERFGLNDDNRVEDVTGVEDEPPQQGHKRAVTTDDYEHELKRANLFEAL